MLILKQKEYPQIVGVGFIPTREMGFIPAIEGKKPMDRFPNRKKIRLPLSVAREFGVPMLFYVLDVGGGLKKDLQETKTIGIEDINSLPM